MHNKYLFSILITLLLLTGGTHAVAQQKQNCKGKQPSEQISCVIKDLSAKQKRQIEAISKEHSANLKTLKKQLSDIRDSIHVYVDKQTDCSAIILPLMDQESALELQLNKELYKMKVRLDKVLTEEQYKTLLNYQHANGLHRNTKHKKQPPAK